jgi:uncharacterized metal-binding protein
MDNKPIGIVACSGASNTGSFTDLVARKLMKNGNANMLCLAKFSIDEKFAENAKNKFKSIVVLDGCPINCAELILIQNGITNFKHINTTDFGIVKGQTPVTEEKIDEIVNYILKLSITMI